MTTSQIESKLIDERKWWEATANHVAEQASSDPQSYYMFQKAQEKLAAVDRALRRVESGTFGLCEVCRERIEPKRLEILIDSDCHTCAACAAASKSHRYFKRRPRTMHRTNPFPILGIRVPERTQ